MYSANHAEHTICIKRLFTLFVKDARRRVEKRMAPCYTGTMKIGIVGLPNVGKSTLFNALTKSKQADAANYPFCTIEPNVGVVTVPDARLAALAAVSKSKEIVPAIVEFVDIAGLVKGASAGEGLGNKFLSHIREVDAIVEVVRAFSSTDVIHVAGRIHPEDDAGIINVELALADMAVVERAKERITRDAKSQNAKDAEKAGGPLWKAHILERVHAALAAGGRAADVPLTDDERAILKELNLLTAKPLLYVINVDEYGAGGAKTQETFLGAPAIAICAQLEAELAELPHAEAAEYLKSVGKDESGLDRLIRASYTLLDLVTFFTSGEKDTHAWTVPRMNTAPQAAGVIHSDFEKAFIRAEVITADDFVAFGGEAGAREHGALRIEGKEYQVADGDVCHFRVGV